MGLVPIELKGKVPRNQLLPQEGKVVPPGAVQRSSGILLVQARTCDWGKGPILHKAEEAGKVPAADGQLWEF